MVVNVLDAINSTIGILRYAIELSAGIPVVLHLAQNLDLGIGRQLLQVSNQLLNIHNKNKLAEFFENVNSRWQSPNNFLCFT